jgi:FMN phosphatase YigB (HAD superfamily)
MRVAIVHYHLGSGGVARVIETTSRHLTYQGIPHVILTGQNDPATGWDIPRQSEPLPLREIPALGYLNTPGNFTPQSLLDSLRHAATEALGAPPEIWHFHNHSLGKNCLLAGVVSLLAASGESILLHLHDLAEEGRPENFSLIAEEPSLYPFSPRIHYAFLNSRDRATFIAAGLPDENAHLLANPLTDRTNRNPVSNSGPPLLFAPIRGIRRKNLGELVLLAALLPKGTAMAVSRAPSNPSALPIHNTWRKFVHKHGFPIEFDVVGRFAPTAGAGNDFETWVNHATHFVTTSVCEGFGLPFLESILHGIPLIGRDLPHLTADHASHGIRHTQLYQRILIPLDWVDSTILESHLTTTLERNHRLYQRPLSNSQIAASFHAILQGDHLDFGNLPESLQQGVIERLSEKANRKIPMVEIEGEASRPLEDWLAEAIHFPAPVVSQDKLNPYSPDKYIRTLIPIYQNLSNQSAAPLQQVSPTAILDAHLKPDSFHFLLSALESDNAKPKYRAVIFDIYGTLLIAPAGGVKPDPSADRLLAAVLESFGHTAPESPSTALHAAVVRHHQSAGIPYPEIDLRVVWREVLNLEPEADVHPLVELTEAVWHPVQPMPGAAAVVQRLARSGISLGLLSNAQSNTLTSLGGIADLFPPELTVLSYQHGIAKPAPELFQMIADRLEGRKISPSETLYIGNDPLQDIVPAAAAGFKTALFTGHPTSLRAGECTADHYLKSWVDLGSII